MSTSTTRRQFIQSMVAGGVAGPLILASPLRAGVFTAPSDRLNVGFIGIGVMGRGHLNRFVGYADVQVVAVCDVVRERRENAHKIVEDRYAKQADKETYKGCKAFVDFRELLALEGLDAVVIATPDHWHAIPTIAAAKAGKDIYCEKPLSRTIGEGRAMCNAVTEKKVIFQTGSQQRSEFGGKFRNAVELIQNGQIGQIKTIRIGVGVPCVPCDLPEQPTPDGTDWNFWLGPAAQRGYNEILCPKGIHGHFPAWRNYREFAGGGVADMGAHHFDIAQWALGMDKSGPVQIEPPAEKANAGLRLVYANGVEMFHGGPSGCTFEGEKGTIYVDRGKLESTPAEIVSRPIGENDRRVYFSENQHRNWLDCVRSRKPTICEVETGHRTATVCHLTNLGYQLRRPLKWDPKQERFENDDEANSLISPPLRSPWTI